MKKIVKILAGIISLLLFVSISTIAIHAEEPLADSSDVVIDSIHFPDENFRSFISSNYDKDGDGVIHDSEINNIKTISCTGYKITEDEITEDYIEIIIEDSEGKEGTSEEVMEETSAGQEDITEENAVESEEEGTEE